MSQQSNSQGAGSTAHVPSKYDYKRQTGCVGLVNQGATCYMNSLLQLLFHTTYFRRAVYEMTTSANDDGEIPRALQNLFFQLQERSDACSTKGLTDSFGWDKDEVYVQHDIQELAAKLRDCLERKMKGSPAEGAINRLFTGYGEKYYRCLDGSYTSRNRDTFYDIHVPIQGYSGLAPALKSLLDTDQLTGDNKYKVEIEGQKPVYKDAETGYRFLHFPPVLFFHLKRFEMDMYSPTLEMKKVNQKFEFPTSIDLSKMEEGLELDNNSGAMAAPATKQMHEQALDQQRSFQMGGEAVYDLYGIIVHRGGVRSGHYFMYTRQFDFDAKKWGKWLEFDDDCVRFVDDEAAVTKNYGGPVYSRMHGETLSSQNAYMLAYCRREDISKVLAPVTTDTIPDSVKDVFKRILEDEEKQAFEEELKRKRCTFQLVTDGMVQDYVSHHVVDLIQPTFKSQASFTLEKEDSLKEVYNKVQQTLGFDPKYVRLWTWAYHYPTSFSSFRINNTFPAYDDCGDTTVSQAIHAVENISQDDEHRPWNHVLYVEYARVPISPEINNAALYSTVRMSSCSTKAPDGKTEFDPFTSISEAKMAHFEPTDKRPTFRVDFQDRVTLQPLLFRWLHNKQCEAYRATIQVEAFDGSQSVGVLTKDCKVQYGRGNEHMWFRFDPPVKATALEISRVEVKAESDSYYYESRPVEPFGLSRLRIFVPEEEIAHHISPPETVPRIMPYDKRVNLFVMVKYFNPRNGTMQFAGSSTIPGLELLRNSFPIFRALCGLDPKAKLLCFEENKPTDLTELSPDMFPSCLTNNAVGVGSIIVVQPAPSELSLTLANLRADHFVKQWHNTRMISIRHVSKPEEVAATVQMSANWRYNFVTDAIGTKLGIKPEYIRLFGPRDAGQNPKPKTEPERSDSTYCTLDTMTRVHQWVVPDLFYDVLDIPLNELEHQVEVKVTYSNALGEPVSENAEFLLPLDATVYELIQHLLKKLDMPFDRPHGLFEIRDHLIQQFWLTDTNGASKDAKQRISDLFRTRSHYYHDKPSFEVRPVKEPGPDEMLVPVARGEFLGDRHSEFFGTPFLVAQKKTASVEEVLEEVMKVTQAPEAELKEHKLRLMMVTDCTLNFPDLTLTVAAYFKHTRSNSSRPSHVMLNQKRPKAKPGSRYVAQNDPVLQLEKKKKPNAGGSPQASGASPGGQ